MAVAVLLVGVAHMLFAARRCLYLHSVVVVHLSLGWVTETAVTKALLIWADRVLELFLDLHDFPLKLLEDLFLVDRARSQR